ncbi:MAG: radical SAM protein [Chloroflexaceae bacterium]|nr:radical SAM protein [Chloroflexaceae bacterium]
MQLAQLTTSVSAEVTRCDACQWRCELGDGETGQCQVRSGTTEGIVLHHYGLISAASIGAIEDHLLWHFFPDSRVLTVGGWGYAFPVDQQRNQYAQPPTDESEQRRLDPNRVAVFALKKLCRGVIWAYGDPAVSSDYVLDVLRACRASSRYTAIITNGYMTLETLDSFGHYLDGISLDLRGFGEQAYKRLAGITAWQGVLDVADRARHRWNCHVEVTLRLHHGVNDDADELRAMVAWMLTTLGDQAPLHVIPGDAGAATASSVAFARRIAHEGGLKFVYGGEADQPTICPKCGNTLITRKQGVVRMNGVNDNTCVQCGLKLELYNSIFKR